jgi:hypothetical protein
VYVQAVAEMFIFLRWVLAVVALIPAAFCDSIPAPNLGWLTANSIQYSRTFTIRSNRDFELLGNAQFRTSQLRFFDLPLSVSRRSGGLWSNFLFSNPNDTNRAGNQDKLLFGPIYLLGDESFGVHRSPSKNSVWWMFFKNILGSNTGGCNDKWTAECARAFANPAYRPKRN